MILYTLPSLKLEKEAIKCKKLKRKDTLILKIFKIFLILRILFLKKTISVRFNVYTTSFAYPKNRIYHLTNLSPYSMDNPNSYLN